MNDKIRETLEWYAEQGAGCRKIGHIGDPARHALDADGGRRAKEALERHTSDEEAAKIIREAARLIEPGEGETCFYIRVNPDTGRTSLVVKSAPGIDAENALIWGKSVLERELEDLKNYPVHGG